MISQAQLVFTDEIHFNCPMRKRAAIHFDPTRRQMSKALALLFAGLTLLPKPTLAGGERKDHISLEQFRILSTYLTGQSALDPGMLRDIFAALIQEPWGKEHMQRLMHKLFPDYPQSMRPRTPLLVPRNLDDAERWFAGHILTTWMTGIYYHEIGNRTISYEHALMFEALKDIRPVPGMSTEPFGFWQEPPRPTASNR